MTNNIEEIETQNQSTIMETISKLWIPHIHVHWSSIRIMTQRDYCPQIYGLIHCYQIQIMNITILKLLEIHLRFGLTHANVGNYVNGILLSNIERNELDLHKTPFMSGRKLLPHQNNHELKTNYLIGIMECHWKRNLKIIRVHFEFSSFYHYVLYKQIWEPHEKKHRNGSNEICETTTRIKHKSQFTVIVIETPYATTTHTTINSKTITNNIPNISIWMKTWINVDGTMQRISTTYNLPT